MRGKVSLSSLDWISYRDAPSRWEKNPPRRVPYADHVTQFREMARGLYIGLKCIRR
jgi:hypothetical protein